MTEDYLRLGLLGIAAAILFLILFEAWNKRRHVKMIKDFELSQQTPPFSLDKVEELKSIDHAEPVMHAQPKAEATPPPSDILMVSIIAKPSCQFASYELLQAILAAGFQFGDMNLFHYFESMNNQKLFSLAASTTTGEFDLNKIGEFSCKGLILFLDLNAVIEPQKAFEKMILTAEQLAEDLDGELRADPYTPWNEATRLECQLKISQKYGAPTANEST